MTTGTLVDATNSVVSSGVNTATAFLAGPIGYILGFIVGVAILALIFGVVKKFVGGGR